MKQLRLLIGLSLTILALATTCGHARADGNDSATGDIPPGTKITMQNWHQYAAFMPAGMQALFEGKYFWKMPPDIELIVGPTVVHPLPIFYQQATERYAPQVKLVATPNGGLALRDYVAGMPFPNPEEPHKGWKILANLWFRYFPHLVSTTASSNENICREDRFSNLACSTQVAVYRQLRHLADSGASATTPDSGDSSGPSFTEFWMIETPEDQKYTSGLTLYYDSQPQADYLFTPKLRRAIRINAGARCSESSGSDFMEDDWRNGFSGDIWDFQAKFVQQMKMLTLINFGAAAGNLAEQNYYFPLMWPRPGWARWELRDTNVIDVRPLAEDTDYCYGKRVIYADANTSVPLWEDLYDSQMNLWKVFRVGTRARAVPGAGVQDSSGSRVSQIWNLKNGHATFLSTMNSAGIDFAIDEQVPKQYDDVKRYSGLSGLNEIMR
ncbi:MAG TPA: DUF1329 domain-containing protein [Candidatus Binataceae bacterium]|nr:DUF1329 domain-containing protein [Candidatus Binataceae bacterium]